MTPKKKTDEDQGGAKKATPKKAVHKQSAPKKTASKKAAPKQAAPKKTAPRKAAVKTGTSGTAPEKKKPVKKAAPREAVVGKKPTEPAEDKSASATPAHATETPAPVEAVAATVAHTEQRATDKDVMEANAEPSSEFETESTLVPTAEPEEAASSAASVTGPDVPSALAIDRIVVFFLEGRRYALPLDAVQEIQQIVELTSVPDDVEAFVGMIDLRGIVVPVVDLRLLLGMQGAEYSIRTPMIFSTVRGQLVALVVDEVDDVVELPSGALQPSSRMSALAERLIGVCRIADDMVFVFDPDQLVPAAELGLLERRAREGA